MNTTPQEGTVCRCGEAYLTLIRWDADTSAEAWSFCAVLAVQGELPIELGSFDDLQVLIAVRELGIHVSDDGSGDAGARFARAPWVECFGEPTRTIILRQSGGLDV